MKDVSCKGCSKTDCLIVQNLQVLFLQTCIICGNLRTVAAFSNKKLRNTKNEGDWKMKKSIALLLAICILFAFAACGGTKGTEDGSVSNSEDNLVILFEQDDSMINNYSLLAVNPEAPFADADGNAVSDVSINTEGAKALINWLLSEEGKAAVAEYGYADFGEYLFYLKEDGPASEAEISQATEATKTIRMSTTTSVNDSGLLEHVMPLFETKYGYTVEITSAGTGKAIANAKAGNADLLLVHSKSQEEEFVEGGFSYALEGFDSQRLTYMYNYFVLCGPASDPAGVKEAADVKAAFALIAEGKFSFVSRGDASGTHTKEISLWPEDLGITTEADSVKAYADWYTYSNAGMGACLTMAQETGSYILSDKATFLTFTAEKD